MRRSGMRHRRKRLSAAMLPLVLVSMAGIADGLPGQSQATGLRTDLNLRPGYHGAWRTDRDGGTSDRQDLRARVRVGARWTPTPALAFRARVAGRLSTDQETLRFHLRDHIPTTDGLRQGEFTVDEAYVRWRPADRFELRAGRMQTSFELAGVPRKSLDRNDSPNTDVSWTDGVNASMLLAPDWRQHRVLQRNGDRGPTIVARAPLALGSPGGRVTVFTAAQLEGRAGIFIQREADHTYIPGAVGRRRLAHLAGYPGQQQ